MGLCTPASMFVNTRLHSPSTSNRMSNRSCTNREGCALLPTRCLPRQPLPNEPLSYLSCGPAQAVGQRARARVKDVSHGDVGAQAPHLAAALEQTDVAVHDGHALREAVGRHSLQRPHSRERSRGCSSVRMIRTTTVISQMLEMAGPPKAATLQPIAAGDGVHSEMLS